MPTHSAFSLTLSFTSANSQPAGLHFGRLRVFALGPGRLRLIGSRLKAPKKRLQGVCSPLLQLSMVERALGPPTLPRDRRTSHFTRSIPTVDRTALRRRLVAPCCKSNLWSLRWALGARVRGIGDRLKTCRGWERFTSHLGFGWYEFGCASDTCSLPNPINKQLQKTHGSPEF